MNHSISPQIKFVLKLQNEVLDFIKNLEFDEKRDCVSRLESICSSMNYSAPESIDYWIKKYMTTLNIYLLNIPNKNELQELLKL